MTEPPGRAEICVLQHAGDTPPALLGEWLDRRRIDHRVVRVDLGAPLPEAADEFAGLVILGSEHSVNSLDPPWVARELALARRAIDTRVPVLGICFGGQMLAAAMGASVGAAASPSIGWCEVAGPRGGLVGDRRWLHFSYEAFALPEGAEQLGELGGTPAAFRRGPHLAVQFHPEATVEIVARWAQWDAARLRRLRIDPAPLIAASAERRAAAREDAFALFDSWI